MYCIVVIHVFFVSRVFIDFQARPMASFFVVSVLAAVSQHDAKAEHRPRKGLWIEIKRTDGDRLRMQHIAIRTYWQMPHLLTPILPSCLTPENTPNEYLAEQMRL